MARDLFRKYVWIVDTLTRYGKLTRQEISDLWMRASISDGRPIPERTFYHYRRAIEENFHIDILCNSNGEYYIANEDKGESRQLSNWLLDSYAVNDAMTGRNIDIERISVEDVPSAREYLPLVLDAISSNSMILFSYAGFNRSRLDKDILFAPYFVKRYKQRWYMVGLRDKTRDIRTYALDRVRKMNIVNRNFEMPADINPKDFFENIIGMTQSKADPKLVKLKTTPSQAKYLRELPLHSSQQEEIHDQYSIFTYQLKLNYELIQEILALGPDVVVEAPHELRMQVMDKLRKNLQNYES